MGIRIGVAVLIEIQIRFLVSNAIMKNYIYTSTIILFILSLSCSTYKKKLKPNPFPETHVLCPFCKGYGVIESYSSEPAEKIDDIDEKKKKEIRFCFDVFNTAELAHDISHGVKPGYSEEQVKDEEKKNNNKNSDPGRYAARSTVKRLVKCPRCEGIGWIKKEAKSEFQFYDKQYLEGIDRANKMIR